MKIHRILKSINQMIQSQAKHLISQVLEVVRESVNSIILRAMTQDLLMTFLKMQVRKVKTKLKKDQNQSQILRFLFSTFII